MKHALFLADAFLAALLIAGCSPAAKQAESAPSGEKQDEPEPRVKHGTNGEVIVTVDLPSQKTMGLATAALQPAQLPPEVKAYGTVLDVAPLAALVSELNTARAASAASEAELKRLQTLAAQDNASQRALQAAQAAAVRDQAQVESVRLRLVAGWGSAIAQQQDLPVFVQSLSCLSNVLVELNVPASQGISAAPTAARLFTLADETKPITAQLLGPAPVIDPQLQGRGFLFLVAPNATQLAPGAALAGFLGLPGEPQKGVALPHSAVVRFNGATWAYLQTSQSTFERTEVRLQQPLTNGWLVVDRLKPGDKVVIVAAQDLLSEELNTPSE